MLLLLLLLVQIPKTAASVTSAAAKVPTGQAVVSDTQLPGQLLAFTGQCARH
jgi:hypothetical protein